MEIEEELRYDFTEALKIYLKDPTSENLEIVIKATEYVKMNKWTKNWYGRKLRPWDIEEKIEKLQKNDKTEWAQLLAEVMRLEAGRSISELKAISPFADKSLIFVNYGDGCLNATFEDPEWLNRLINEIVGQTGKKTYDYDKYFIALSKSFSDLLKVNGIGDKDNSEVIWVGSSRH